MQCKGRSRVKKIDLRTDQLLNGQPELNPLSTEFLADFLSFFVNGIRECLEIRTELGTLETLNDIFVDLGFIPFQLGIGSGYTVR